MLKVLYLPIGSQPGTIDGFKNAGVDLRVYDFHTASQQKGKPQVCAEFLQHVEEHKPDLVHMQLQMTRVIDVKTLKKAKSIVPNAVFTNWTGDIRKRPDPGFVSTSHAVDYSLNEKVKEFYQE